MGSPKAPVVKGGRGPLLPRRISRNAMLAAAAAAAAVVVVVGAITALSWPNTKPVSLSDLKLQTHYHGLAVDRTDPTRLLLATHHGFFVVDKGGMATRISPVQDFMGFTPHPTDNTVLLASGHPSSGGNLGFIRSDDGGVTWKQLSPGLGGPVDFHAMDISLADPKVIYGSFHGIQVSRDGGQTWMLAGPAPEGLIALAASRSSADRVYAATQSGLLVSADAGKSWTTASFGSQAVSMVGMGAGPKVFAFVVGKGLQQATDDALGNWTALSNDFGGRVLLHFAVDSADSKRMYATTEENDVLASTDGGHSWYPFGTK